jgi:hypothetical protein
MHLDLQLATLIVAAVAAVGAVVSGASAFVILHQLRSDHERSRRENAVNLMFKYTSEISTIPHMALYVEFVDKLDFAQCESYIRGQPFRMTSEHLEVIRLISNISGTPFTEGPGGVEISTEMVFFLKKHTGIFLNALESISAAARYHVADTEIIEDEFRTVYFPKGKRGLLPQLRLAYNIFPSIDVVQDRIEKRGRIERQPIAK